MKKIIFIFCLSLLINLGILAGESEAMQLSNSNLSRWRIFSMRVSKSTCNGIEWIAGLVRGIAWLTWVLPLVFSLFVPPIIIFTIPFSISFFILWIKALIIHICFNYINRKVLPAFDPQAYLAISKADSCCPY